MRERCCFPNLVPAIRGFESRALIEIELVRRLRFGKTR
jgi:hypothetical protein